MKLIALLFSSVLALCLPSCVTPIAPIAERALSAEERRLIGTWATTEETPHPQLGIAFPLSTVVHFHPDRSARLEAETHNIWQGRHKHTMRWELVNGVMRQTSGMRSITMRCTFVDDKTLRIDNSSGSYIWRRYNNDPDSSTQRAMDQEGSRHVYAKRNNSGPMTEMEKLFNRPVSDFFPDSHDPYWDSLDQRDKARSDQQRRIQEWQQYNGR